MTLVRLTADLAVNPDHVASVSWDRGHTYSALIITMADGTAHSVRHHPGPYGLDAYEVERKLLEAVNG